MELKLPPTQKNLDLPSTMRKDIVGGFCAGHGVGWNGSQRDARMVLEPMLTETMWAAITLFYSKWVALE